MGLFKCTACRCLLTFFGSHNNDETFARKADPLGYVDSNEVLNLVQCILALQRDFGDRKTRRHARMKYLLHDRGIDWFKQELISPSSKIIILEHDKNKIGVVRYDKEDSFYLVSINTNPAHRGKGLSSEMLIYSENLIDKGIEPVNLKANILKENLISKRTFIKAGYEFLREEDTFLCYTKSLQG